MKYELLQKTKETRMNYFCIKVSMYISIASGNSIISWKAVITQNHPGIKYRYRLGKIGHR